MRQVCAGGLINDQRIQSEVIPAGLPNPAADAGGLPWRVKSPSRFEARQFAFCKQSKKLQTIFIRHAFVIGGQAPVRAERLSLVKPERDVGIADVDGEKHFSGYPNNPSKR